MIRVLGWDDVYAIGNPKAKKVKTYKYHRTCASYEYREKHGYKQPDYCKKEFDTNRPTKMNCCSFCSLEYNETFRRFLKQQEA